MTRLKYIWMFTIVFFFGLPSVMQAQKKEIAAARDQVKEGKDLNKAQASMEKLLKDSANLGNKKIWVTLFDAVRKQYEQGNEKHAMADLCLRSLAYTGSLRDGFCWYSCR